MNSTGSSSIASGTSAAGTRTPRSAEARTRKSATGSAPLSRGFTTSISPPMLRRMSSSPVRVGFNPTFSISKPSASARQAVRRR